MDLMMIVAFLSCIITLVNGMVEIMHENMGSLKMRIRRDTLDTALTEKPETRINEQQDVNITSREADTLESRQIVKDEVKEVNEAEGEDKHLGIIKKPFEAISSIFNKKPQQEPYNQGNGNHYSSYQSSPQLNHVHTVQIPGHNTPNNPHIGDNKPYNIFNQKPQPTVQIYPLETGSISSFPNQHQGPYSGGFNQKPHTPGNIFPLQSHPVSSIPNYPSQSVHIQNKPHHHHTSNKPHYTDYQKPHVGDFIPFNTKPQAPQKPNIQDIVVFPEEPHGPSKPHDAYFSQTSQYNGNKPGLISKPQQQNIPNYQSVSSHHDHQHSSSPCENKPQQSNTKPSVWSLFQKPTSASKPGYNTNNNLGSSHGSNFQTTPASGIKPNSQSNNKPFLGSLFQKPNKPKPQLSQKPPLSSSNKPQRPIFNKPFSGPIWYPGPGSAQQFFGPINQNPYSFGPQFGSQGFHQNPWSNNYNHYQSQHYFNQFPPAYFPQYNTHHATIQLSKPDFYNGNQKPNKKPLATQTSFQGHTTLTRKQFLSLFKPVMALASILKKPIILEPIMSEVMALQPHDEYHLGSFGSQQYQGKPPAQGYLPYKKPNENNQNPNFLRPQSGRWELIRGNVGSLAAGGLGMAFGPIGPIVSSFSRPYLSQAVHGLSGGYLAKDSGLSLEPESAPFYMLDDEDESQNQEYPVLLPLELLDRISIIDDVDDKETAYSTQSETVVQPNKDVSATRSIELQQSVGEVSLEKEKIKDKESAKENKDDTVELNNTERESISEDSIELIDVDQKVQSKEASEISTESTETKAETSVDQKKETVETGNNLIKFGLD